MKKKKALSFLEILLSTMLLVTTLAGFLACLLSVRRAIERCDRRVSAYNVVRQLFDELYVEVREDTWDQGGNGLEAPTSTAGTYVTGPHPYQWQVDVTIHPTEADLRIAQLTINIPGVDD